MISGRILPSMKHSLQSILWYSKFYKAFKPWYSGIGSILMFHRVLPDHQRSILTGNRSIEISTTYFEKILDYLEEANVDIISIDEVVNRLSDPGTDRRFTCLTFDDGYIDTYEIVYPILKKRQIPFCVYVVPDYLDHKQVLWWYMIEKIIHTQSSVTLHLNYEKFRCSTSTPRAQNIAFYSIRERVKLLNESQRGEWIEDCLEKYNLERKKYSQSLTMDWTQLKKLASDPLVTIGAHSFTHPALSRLSESEAYHEIAQSKSVLETALERPVTHFAYPFGGPDEASQREFQLAKKAGFITATTTRNAPVFRTHSDKLAALPRLMIDGNQEHISQIHLLCSGAFPAIQNKLKRVL